MPKLTKTFVDNVTLPALNPDGSKSQEFHRDTALPGFALRVTSGGTKSFIIETRIDGKVKRKTIGKFGAITVEQARKQAQIFRGEVASGTNPINEAKKREVKATTLKQAFDDYLAVRKNLKPGTIHDYTRVLNEAFPDWQNKPLTSITKEMVAARHAELGKKSPARANNAMRVLRAIFNHARHSYETPDGNTIIQINPVDRLSQSRGWYNVKRRQTVIKAHQLKEWYQATLQINPTTRDYLHLVLFTGLRKMEAARLTWADIDLEGKTLTVRDTKNQEPHTLPLSDFLHELLVGRKDETSGKWLFPNPQGDGHLKEPRTAVDRVASLSGVEFTLHDLRRTFITVAESLDIPAYALKRLLNHKMANDVTAGYIVSDVERLRLPMQKITDHLQEKIHS